MWHLFEADTANELWTEVVETLSGGGPRVHIQPSRCGRSREILHAVLTLRCPTQRWLTVRSPALNPGFAIAEVFWILGGRSDAKFLSYFSRSFTRYAGAAPLLHGAYGYRLRRHFGVDQLQHAYETFRSNPESRQVVLQIWDAGGDLPQGDGQPRNHDIPCNTQSILKIRAAKLEWVQVMRSNDVFLGLPHNLIQFTMLQEILAGWLDVEPGHYHHLSDSLHLYDGDGDFVPPNPRSEHESWSHDVFALPKDESAAAITTVIGLIELIIDETCPVEEITRLVLATSLPTAYRNALFVMAAEGLRRRKDPVAAAALMNQCNSATFSQMWMAWCERLKVAKT